MAQPVQFPPPSWKFYPIVYVTNGQEFLGTDLEKLGTTEWMTDDFIERGIRAVAHMPNDEEGIALTVSAAWDWPGSKVKSTITQRLTATDHAAMALIVRGSGWHFTLDVRFFGKITRNYLVDSLLPPVTSSRPVVDDIRAKDGETKDKRAKAETLEQGQIRSCREDIPADQQIVNTGLQVDRYNCSLHVIRAAVIAIDRFRSYRMGITTADELALDMMTEWQSLKGIRYTERKFWAKLISEGDIRVRIPHQANSISLSDHLHNTGERTRRVETPEVEISQTARSKETSGKKVKFDLPK